MRKVANIIISATVLILLVFGTGGLSLMKCSCSGKVTFVTPSDGCCPSEGNCMTVKIWKVSDADQSVVSFDHVVPVDLLVNDLQVLCLQPDLVWRPVPPVDSRPPGRTCTSVSVLRV